MFDNAVKIRHLICLQALFLLSEVFGDESLYGNITLFQIVLVVLELHLERRVLVVQFIALLL